jgi:hypothetical protein
MEEGESLVGVTVVVVVMVVVMVVLLSHESLAEETTTTTTTLPNYQPLPTPPFFFPFSFFLVCVLQSFTDKPKNLCKFQHYTTFQRQTQKTYANFKTSQSSTDKPKTQCKISITAQSATDKPKKLVQILKLHNLPQINPKLNANFKNCTICHRQTQKLMQISKLHKSSTDKPKTHANFKTAQPSTDKPKT